MIILKKKHLDKESCVISRYLEEGCFTVRPLNRLNKSHKTGAPSQDMRQFRVCEKLIKFMLIKIQTLLMAFKSW